MDKITTIDLPYQRGLDLVATAFDQYPYLFWFGAQTCQATSDTQKDGSRHPDQRYEFLSCDPIETTTKDTGILNKWRQRLKSTCGDLIPEHSIIDTETGPLPGIMGILSYDWGEQRQLQNTLSEDKDSIPFYAGLYPWILVTDHKQATTRLIFINDLATSTHQSLFLKVKSITQKTNADSAGVINDSSVESPQVSSFKASKPYSWYQQAFSKTKEYILAGDVYQINLTQRFQATITDQKQGSRLAIFQHLKEHHSTPFSFYINLQSQHVISLSPERFVRIDKGLVETKPIKGTIKRGATKEEDEQNALTLQSSVKDRAENLMIVDLLRNDLSKHARPNTVKVPKLFALESFSNVHHLVSTVHCELKQESTEFDLLLDAFPGGSITGAPKKRAMEIIDELEAYDRKHYCGSAFYWSINDTLDSSILIRTLVSQNDQLYCWGGGGIVADSELESEYNESITKVRHLMNLISSYSE